MPEYCVLFQPVKGSKYGNCANKYLGNHSCLRERAKRHNPNSCAQRALGEWPLKRIGCRPDINRPQDTQPTIIR